MSEPTLERIQKWMTRHRNDVDPPAVAIQYIKWLQAEVERLTQGCCACRAVGQGGYEIETMAGGTFCRDCWDALREHFTKEARDELV